MVSKVHSNKATPYGTFTYTLETAAATGRVTSPRSEAQKQGGNFMPQNGETNRKFGFFKNLCCEKEIVVPAGNEFPGCPNHPGLTIWQPIVGDDNVVQLIKKRKSDHPMPRFNVGDQIIFVGVGPHKGKQGDLLEVIESSLDFVHRYHVRLNDGTTLKCFGFELEPLENQTSKSA
jgi:hypothetical protein